MTSAFPALIPRGHVLTNLLKHCHLLWAIRFAEVINRKKGSKNFVSPSTYADEVERFIDITIGKDYMTVDQQRIQLHFFNIQTTSKILES